MTYKHKTHAVDPEGKIISNADVDFYIDDVCHFLFDYILLFVLKTCFRFSLEMTNNVKWLYHRIFSVDRFNLIGLLM